VYQARHEYLQQMKARITEAVARYGNKACFKPRGPSRISSGYKSMSFHQRCLHSKSTKVCTTNRSYRT